MNTMPIIDVLATSVVQVYWCYVVRRDPKIPYPNNHVEWWPIAPVAMLVRQDT